jgi:nondiscriminating aspartyl-tRNA synthetase
MKKRTLINEIKKDGEKIFIKGRVFNIRNLGKLVFLSVQDYTGIMQVVFKEAVDVKVGEAVELEGIVKEDSRSKFGFEVQGESIEVVSKVIEEFPIDLTKNDLNLNLASLLEYRTLSLRHPKVQAIFKLYDVILKAYETVMREEGFTEIKTPKLLGSATEGGANFFKVKYFDKEATLAQSPQFYKQIMMGVFERVFEIGSTFRAEPHFTTRHVNEYISLDAEMGFIDNFYDIVEVLNRVLFNMFAIIEKEGKPFLEMYNIELSKVPEKIPCVKLSEIRKIVKEKYDYEIPEDVDIDPEGERLAGRYAKEEFNSDFIFITHYPWGDKPFYTMPSKENTEETCGFDLLFKGLEIVTGGQRIHDYEQLIENLKAKGVNSKGMEYYLETFKYSIPPHGGWGMGSERLVQQILELGSIKQAVLFPRDVKRLIP